MRDGASVLTSRGKNTVVTIQSAARQVNNRPVFVVSLENRAKTPVEFRVTNVIASEYLDGVPAAQLKVFSYQELVDEEKNAQVNRAIATGVLAGLNSGLAGRNYYAQSVANQQNVQLAANVAAQGQQNMISLEQQVIKDHTLMPGEVHGGKIALTAPESDGAKTYLISITLGSDKHEFYVSQSRG